MSELRGAGIGSTVCSVEEQNESHTVVTGRANSPSCSPEASKKDRRVSNDLDRAQIALSLCDQVVWSKERRPVGFEGRLL